MGLSTLYIATLAVMDGSGASRRTRATGVALPTVAALLASFAFATGASAQSAGDKQYADPLVNGGGQSQQQEQSSPQPQTGSGTSSPTAPPTSSLAPTQADAGTVASDAAALPRTGADVGLLAALGLLLFATGILLRRPRPTAPRGSR